MRALDFHQLKSLAFRGLLLALPGGCGTVPDHPAPAPVSAASRPKPPWLGQWALAGYHRYRGWLGTEPITMELTFSPGQFGQGPECNGCYYYERYGRAMDVLGQRLMAAEDSAQSLVFWPGRPLLLSTWGPMAEQWQAVQVAGPLLHGLWTSRFGLVRQYFELREDYEGAVRYEIADARAYTVCTPYDEATGESYSDTSAIVRSYLHLLGPDTLLPALGRLQCPGPARRRAEVQALARDQDNDCTEMSESLAVLFNGWGLLTVGRYNAEERHLQPHPNHRRQTMVFDLRTGRALSLRDLLVPGAAEPLRQLLARNVIRTMGYTPMSIARDERGLPVAPLPEGGVGVLSDGLLFAYGDDELVGYAGGMPEIVVPFPELRPLLRPHSPLTPLLRARGLRPGH